MENPLLFGNIHVFHTFHTVIPLSFKPVGHCHEPLKETKEFSTLRAKGLSFQLSILRSTDFRSGDRWDR